MKHLTSRDNPLVRELRQLATSSRERRKLGRTLLDGVHLVDTWLQQVGLPRILVVAESARDKAEVMALAQRVPPDRCVLLTDALFAQASPVETPAGVLAVVDIPPLTGRQSLRNDCVVLEAIQDAGNLGTILRACAAAGVVDVALTQGCVHVWSPKVLRAAQGAHTGLRLIENAEPALLLQGFPGAVLATRLDARNSLFASDLRGPVAWLFGNEGAGLSADLTALATSAVRIPMPGAVESLNVAMAATVCLFEQVRQKLGAADAVPCGAPGVTR